MRIRPTIGFLAACVAAVGCQDEGSGASSARQPPSITAADTGVARFLVLLADSTGHSNSCQAGERPSAAQAVLSVTAKQCMSCLNLGYYIRSLEKEARATGETLWIALPADDSAQVCQYLKLEKVTAPALIVHERSGTPPFGSAYVLVRNTKDGPSASIQGSPHRLTYSSLRPLN